MILGWSGGLVDSTTIIRDPWVDSQVECHFNVISLSADSGRDFEGVKSRVDALSEVCSLLLKGENSPSLQR